MVTTSLFVSMLFASSINNCAIQPHDPQDVDGRPCVEALARSATDMVLQGEYPAWVERFGFDHSMVPDELYNAFAEDATRLIGQLRDELFD